jgi:hypothetical protein
MAKAETETARQLFLYGAGDGKRIISVKGLVEATGLHENTICKHITKWQKEAEEILANTAERGLGLALSAEDLRRHKEDMAHLRNLVEAKKWETERVLEITAKLEGWMDKFSGDDGEQDKALRILELWMRTCGQKSSLESQFLALQKQWTSLSGVVDLKDIQVVKEKAMATGRARLALKKEETETGPKEANPATGIFARE